MFRFSIDRGGTFTDVYAECPGRTVRVLKLLSEDPLSYSDAPTEAIRRVLQQVYMVVDILFDNSHAYNVTHKPRSHTALVCNA